MRSLGIACNAASARAQARGDRIAVAAARDEPQHAPRHRFAVDAPRDEEAAAEIARIVAVEHDVRDRHAGGFGGADRLRFEHDRRQFDVRVRNRRDHQLVPRLAVVGVEQHVQPARAGAGDAEPRNVDVALPPLGQEASEPVAHRVGHGNSPRASQSS